MAQTHIKNKCCKAQYVRSCLCIHPENGRWTTFCNGGRRPKEECFWMSYYIKNLQNWSMWTKYIPHPGLESHDSQEDDVADYCSSCWAQSDGGVCSAWADPHHVRLCPLPPCPLHFHILWFKSHDLNILSELSSLSTHLIKVQPKKEDAHNNQWKQIIINPARTVKKKVVHVHSMKACGTVVI